MPPATFCRSSFLRTARHKVRMAEDAWNTRDPDQVVLVYTADTHSLTPARLDHRKGGIEIVQQARQLRQFAGVPGRRDDPLLQRRR
jgi:nuclear transport factor 2 (NTF2) superfamily protein